MKTPQIPQLKTIFLLGCFLLLNLASYAQVPVPFTVRYERNLKGDMTLISNGIVNRQHNSNGPNVPYNEVGNSSQYNDNFDMRYIDIDGDPSTFSSSSASLILPASGCNKIVYAGLYWSATYRFNNGYSTNPGDGDNVRANDFNQVRLKLPGGAYQNITGQLIFDGFTSPDFIANSPYSCFADITSLVTGLANPEGEYTVANIRATQGFINGGGVSGGWTIFFVYENPTMTGKYITAYDGFAGVRAAIGQTDINYSGFTTLPPPFPVRAKLASAALEGDNRITGDQLLFRAASNATFTALGNTLNATNNFFNSRLTLNNVDFLDRVPNSLNTLGYDGDIITVANPLNSVIPNNETAATLRITSNQDTYFMFFNAFNIEVIEPDIKLVKTVEDLAGNDIGGADVNLGQFLDYVVTFQNVGNDDATNATIRDILPINTSFISVDLSGAPGVTFTHDPAFDELVFTLPNNLVEIGDPVYTIRIRVQVATTCSELEDACSNLIQNQAYATYRGILNSNWISNDPSFAGLDSCGFGQPGPANFLVDIDDCIFENDAYLCGTDLTLTAANGYETYTWYNSSNQVIGNTQTITVSNVGTYTVVNTATPPCIGITQTFNVLLFGATQTNPVIPFADEVVICPNNGEQLPLIFLCGTNDSQLIQTGISDATSIVWEVLNEASCPPVGIDTCANNNPACSWNQVGTGANFNVTTAGQYRLTINYQDGCFTRFYFNVFTNLLDIQYVTTNILCNTPGSITITNLPSDYQFQLVDQMTGNILVPYQNNPVFTISNAGVYTVQVTQIGVTEGCVFELPNIGIQQNNFQVNLIPQNTNCNGFGSIRVQATGAQPQYQFSITNPISATSGWVVDNDYTFDNLNPGTYTVTVVTEDGCSFTGTVTIEDQNDLELVASVSQNITCNQGNILVNPSGGQPPYSFTIYSFNGALLNPTSADYQTSVIFDIEFGQQGTYVFIVVDANNCTALSNPVTIELVPNVQFTTTVQNINCFGQNNGSIVYNLTSSNGFQVSYQLLDENGNIISTNNSGIFNNLPAGNYTVVLVQSQGNRVCEFPTDFTITEPTPMTGVAEITENYTCITNAGTINIVPGSITGGTAPYLFSIDGVNFVSSSEFANLTSGNYTIYIQDANGCIFTTNTISLVAPNQLTDLTFNATALTCPAQNATVTVTTVGGTAPFTYQIIAPAGQTVNNGTNPIFAGLTAGTYTFEVTDSNGCTYQETYTINPLPIIDVIGQTISNVVCFGASNGAVTFTVTNSNPYNYQIVNSSNAVVASANNSNLSTISLTGLTASTYTITITDTVTNCTDTATAIVEAPSSALAFTFVANQISCNSNGSVIITATGGWGSYQYQLTQPNGVVVGPQSNATFTNLTQAGTYTISVNDINGCVVSNTFNLTTPTNPVAVIASSSDLCFDANGATLVIAVTGGVVPYTYSINGNPSQNSNTFANLTPGSYTVIVTDANGCTSTVSQTIQPELTGDFSLTKGLDCTASPNAQISAAIAGGLAPFTYQVSFNSGAFGSSTNVVGTNFVYSTANAGNYQFLITDAQGCTFTSQTITVEPLTLPEITSVVELQGILCHGGNEGEIQINTNNAVGLAPFVLEVINTTTGVNYGTQTSGLTAGNYQITLTDANSCTDTASITLTEPNPIAFTISTVDITCNNPGGTSYGEIIVQGVAGGTAQYTYILNNNFGFIASYTPVTNENHSFQILNFGIYNVEVIDANGCVLLVDNIIIASPPSDLIIDVSTSTSDCVNGGTAVITVTSAVSSGSYEFAILETNVLPYSTNYQPADVGTPETSTFTGLVPGVTYTFVVHDLVTDCYYFKTADTPINTPSNLTSVLDVVGNVSCTGSNDGFVNFTFDNYDATATSVSYEVFNSQSNISTGITGTSSPLGGPISVTNLGPLAPGIYYILFTENGGTLTGCSSASVPFTISQSTNLLQVTANVTRNDNCLNNRGRITATGQFGTAPYQYQLVVAGDPAPTVLTWAGSATNVFNVEGGNYVVYIRDANGCIQSAPVFVPTDPSPQISATVTNLCTAAQGDFTIEVTLTTAGIAPYTFSLNGGTFQAQTVPTFTYTNLNSGNYSIRVRDFNGCIHTVNLTIPAPLNLTPAITAQTSCANNDGIITVTPFGGSGTFTYELQNNVGGVIVAAQASPIFNGLASGNYVVVINDTTTGCSAQAPIELEPATPVTFTTVHNDVSCNGGNDGSITVTLPASNDNPIYTYVLTDGVNAPISQNNGVFTGLAAGTYTITVTSARNCSLQEIIVIDEPALLTVAATATDFACDASNVVQTSTITAAANFGTAPYVYSINGTNFFASNTFTIVDNGSVQNITVTVRDANNCLTTTLVNINPLPTITAVTTTTVTNLTCTNDGTVQINVTGGSGDFTFELLPLGSQPAITPGSGVFSANFTLTEPGTYTFQVTDNETGCYFITAPYTITPFDTIEASIINSSAVTCFGDTDGTITVNVLGYVGNVTYDVIDIQGNTVASGSGNTAINPFIVSGLSGGNYQVVVTATETPFCTATSNFAVVSSPSEPLVLTANETANVTCTNNLGEIFANAIGGWGTYQYELVNNTTATTVQPFGANSLFTGLAGGNYTVSVQDAGGCLVSTTVILVQPSLISANLTSINTNLLCNGDTNASVTAANVIGGQGTYQYILNTYDSTGTTIVTSSGGQTSPTFDGLGAGIYSITITDGWNCDFTTNIITITEPTVVVASLTLTSSLTCTNDAIITLSASGGTAPYQYSTDGITFTNTTVYNVGPGTYQFFVRDANNCAVVQTNQITIETIPDLELNLNLNSANINCFGESTATIIANTTGGLGNYSYTLLDNANNVIAGPQSSGMFTNLPSGSYIVEVDSVDCNAVSSLIQITDPQELMISNLTVNNVLCNGGENGSVSIQTTGGTGTVQYAISPNLNQFFNTGTFNNLAPGNYDIIVQDQNGCFILLDIEITEPAPLIADVDLTTVVQNLCLGDNDGSFTVLITGGTAPYSTSLNNQDPGAFVEGQLSFSGLEGGTDYFIFVKDANGCETIAYIFLDAPVEVIPAIESVVYNCSGNVPGNIVTVSVNASAVGNVQYALDGGTYQASNVFVNVPAGNHTISVQHTNGCTKTVDMNIDDNQPLSATLSSVQNVLCNGDSTGSVTIDVTGGTGTIEYAISPNLTTFTTNNVFTNLAAGTYDIIVRDGIGCSVTQQVIITEPTVVTSSVSALVQELCTNDGNASISIAVNGGVAPYSTSLNDQNNFVANQFTYSNLTGGQTYTIFIQDANGCISSIPVTLDAPVTIIPTVDIAYFCTGNVVGNTVTVSVNSEVVNDVTYSLDGGTYQTSPSFTNVPVGNHTISVQHTNGCTQTVNFIIDDIQPISVTVSNVQNALCNGDSTGSVTINGTGGSGTIEYAISPNLTTFTTNNVFTNLTAGTYTIIVRDGIGCTLSQEVIITEPTVVTSSVSALVQELCTGDGNASITITVNGGVAPYSTSLNNQNNFVANQFTYSNLTGGQTYTIFIRDANDCISSIPVTLDAPVTINPTVAVTYVCTGNVVGNAVTVSVNSAVVNNVTYSLDGGTFQASATFTNVAVGNHTITVRHTNGCEQQVLFTITPSTPVQALFTQVDVTCHGESTGSFQVSAFGGSGQLEFAVSPNLTDFGPNQTFTNLPAGNYTVIVRDEIGCTTQLNITINQPNALNTSLVTMFPDLCAGDNVGAIEISINGGIAPYSTSLNNENNYTPNRVLFEDLAGGQTYTIYVRDANGCVTTLEVDVDGGINISPATNIVYGCVGDTALNTVTVKTREDVFADVTFSLDGGAFQTGNVFTNLSNGNHSVTVLHEDGCSETIGFTISNYIPIALTLSETYQNQFTATTTGGSGSYTYYLNGVDYGYNNVFQILATGTYTVLVRDENGCTAEAQIYIEFIDIDIPNFFTPNDDGDNDTWVPENLEGFPNARVEVFDRYGRIITQFGHKGEWDGTYNGSLLPTGDYWYTITLDGGRQFVGNVTLYR
ncbi:T9SS type B sorting domain-containing protein [Flavobacterium azooxidireducens]|uniref:T9SS type B sorting domain-containing protein n=1 Tax=Flavobacterium azooxidireducens TaxID=1871076 RepID=A0ABY4KI46_9FLAO|nr:T9SS type B sorting domain-containing protein [Flavobacterium azooxidireducens]UPQ80493.1 T9SS type B sorting domain-containing protein [Flavobacterium azooxidireducens]